MFAFIVTIVSLLVKLTAILFISKIVWQLWWNRPGAAGRTIPGDMGWPLVGDTLAFYLSKPRNFARDGHRKYGPVFKSHLLGRPTVFMASGEDIKKCLSGEERVVISYQLGSVKRLAGDAIVNQHGQQHYENKSLFSKSISASNLQQFLYQVQPHIDIMMESWLKATAAGDSVLIIPEIEKVVMIMGQLFVYNEYDEEKLERLRDSIVQYGFGLLAMPIDLPFTKFGKTKLDKKKIRDDLLKDILAREAIIKARKDPEPATAYLDALIELRLQNGNDDDYEKILDQAVLGLTTPVLTTVSGLLLILNTLAKRPDLVQRLRQEQREMLKESDFKQMDITTIRSLPLLDSFISEIWRLFPMAMMVFRLAIKDFETHDGFEVPAGWNVFLDLDASMTQTANILDIDKFMPERFLKSTDKDFKPNQFECTFFGAGSRRCPGSEMAVLITKLFLIMIINKCDFSFAPGCNVIIEDNPAPYPSHATPMRLVFTNAQ